MCSFLCRAIKSTVQERERLGLKSKVRPTSCQSLVPCLERWTYLELFHLAREDVCRRGCLNNVFKTRRIHLEGDCPDGGRRMREDSKVEWQLDGEEGWFA